MRLTRPSWTAITGAPLRLKIWIERRVPSDSITWAMFLPGSNALVRSLSGSAPA